MAAHNIERQLQDVVVSCSGSAGASMVHHATDEFANVKMPSGEIRLIKPNCMATIGRGVEHNNIEHG